MTDSTRAPDAAPIVQLRGVEKHFTVRTKAEGRRFRRDRHDVVAVDGIDLTVRRGAAVGYIGPNGAGKSTTIKMLTGILVPSAGEVRVAGLDPSRNRRAVTARIGVVFGQRSQLWWDLPLHDSFDLLRHVYRCDPARHRANVERYTELLDLAGFLATPVRQLSLGQRMRGELVAALLHDPEILFLDEPTIGLDVVSRDAVRTFLAELNREDGVTILLTTHDLDDVDHLCDRLVVIDHGRVIEDAPLVDVKARYGPERTVVVDLVDASNQLHLAGTAHVRAGRSEGPRRWLHFERATTSAAAVIQAVTDEVGADAIRDLSIEEPDIDDVIRRIYGSSGSKRASGLGEVPG